MTLEEAKKLYRDCGGDDPYIIWHEAGEKTLAEYSALNIPFEVKREWAAEILEQDFASMQREPDRSSSAVADILTMMNYEYVNAQMIGAGLLDALEDQMRREDPTKLTREQAMNRILIIEDMTSLLRKKGGCQLFYEADLRAAHAPRHGSLFRLRLPYGNPVAARPSAPHPRPVEKRRRRRLP